MSLFEIGANYPASTDRRPFGAAIIASLMSGLASFRGSLEQEEAAPQDRRNGIDRDYLKDLDMEIGF